MPETPVEKPEFREDSLIKYKIERFYDHYADYSWLGKWSSKPDTAWYIDRKRGVLVGPETTGRCSVCGDDDADHKYKDEWICESCLDLRYEYDEHVEVVWPVYQEFPTNVRDIVERNAYEYWIPSSNHNPPPDNENESVEESIKFMIEDYKYAVDLCILNCEWVEYIVVTAYIDGTEIGRESVSGIFSPDDDYIKEVTDDLISEIKAGLKESLTSLKEEIDTVLEKLNHD